MIHGSVAELQKNQLLIDELAKFRRLVNDPDVHEALNKIAIARYYLKEIKSIQTQLLKLDEISREGK